MTPARRSVWIGSPARPRRSGTRAPAASSAPAKAATESPTVAASERSSPQSLPEHHAERGAAGDAQHRGVRERVPRQRLERRAGDRERAAASAARMTRGSRAPAPPCWRGPGAPGPPAPRRRRPGGGRWRTRNEACDRESPGHHERRSPTRRSGRSRHALRMDRARQRAERLDHPGARPVDEVPVHPEHPALPARNRGEPLPSAEEVLRPLPVTADDDAVRPPLDDRLQGERGYGKGSAAGDALAAGQPDELGDERVLAPARSGGSATPRRGRAGAASLRPPARWRRLRAESRHALAPAPRAPARHRSARSSRARSRSRRAGRRRRAARAREALNVLRVVALGRGDDQVGPERQDRLEARRRDAADARLPGRLGRIVAVVGHPDQPLAVAQDEDGLRDARRQRHDPASRGPGRGRAGPACPSSRRRRRRAAATRLTATRGEKERDRPARGARPVLGGPGFDGGRRHRAAPTRRRP